MIIQRKQYLEKLISLKDKKIIKIITGVRRCGKSTLMEMFINYLIENGVDKHNIIFINFEDYDFYELRDPSKLYEYIKKLIDPNKQTYIFLDEIQHVTDFPRIVDALYIKNNIDIYITGSNAYMLSSELATLISGRYIEISMLPLSFSEYVASTGDKTDLARKYREYIENSSFPYAIELKNQPRDVKAYLEGIYNTVVVKDIVSRKKITDVIMLENVIRFVFDNIGNKLSIRKIADTLNSDGRKTDTKTIEKYISGLIESFVIYKAYRYNIKGKELLKTLEKYYVVDIGLRYMLLGSRSTDVGHILENIVYLELLRRGYDVYVGKFDDLEIDFVAVNDKKTVYYQVTATVRDWRTLERELRSLNSIQDHYEKIILTLDEDPEADYDGIRRINVLDWLIEDSK